MDSYLQTIETREAGFYQCACCIPVMRKFIEAKTRQTPVPLLKINMGNELRGHLVGLGCRSINIPGQATPRNARHCTTLNKNNSTCVPEYVYRVFYDQSSTIYYPNHGFFSPLLFEFSSDFRDAFIAHMDWYSSSLSPFISLWNSRSKALRWAGQLARNIKYPHTNIKIAKISVEKLVSHSFFFKSTDLISHFYAYDVIREGAKSDDEYLCLWYIPETTIESIEDYSNMPDIYGLEDLLANLTLIHGRVPAW